jgi:alanine racemase
MKPGHGALLTIDLGALAANWRLLAARASPAECAAVIKADAYGTGIATTAPALFAAGCRTFFVAHLSEAEAARAALPGDAVIYVLNGLPPGTAPLYGPLNARPVLGSFDELGEWRAANGGAAAVHVDTGMNRLGFAVRDVPDLADALAGLEISLVMTHFTASEVPEDPMTGVQALRFAALKTVLAAEGRRFGLFNSSAHFREALAPHDMTRAGYALYGGNPTPGAPNPMRPVVRLEAPILSVRAVKDGESAGYNSRWTAKGARVLATISVGYADGYPRNAGGTDAHGPRGHALVGGVLCPFAGTVSMDLTIIDITDAPAEHQRRGATALLIGDRLDIDAVGQSAQTIGYEMLTQLGWRYRRQIIGP